MAERISTTLGVSHESLDAAGVFDRFVDLDSQLHVDPHLLYHSAAPECREAATALEQFWQDTVSLLRNIGERGDTFWRASVKRLTFPENANVGLGYAQTGTVGAAVGPIKAARLVETGASIVRAGVTDPKVFELVGLLEPSIGPDLISDMTVDIVEPYLLRYTERVCRELGIQSQEVTVRGQKFSLPVSQATGSYLVLLPKDVLRDLPVAFCWDDVDHVCAYNEAIRSQVNSLIGENWKRACADNRKEKIKRVLLEHPAALEDLIRQYREKPAEPYDFAEDFLGETIWFEAAQGIAEAYPLDLQSHGPVTPENIMPVVRRICDHFRTLIEDNGLWRLFWTDKGRVRHERFAQLLFFGVADAYCKANGLDLSPETNSGRGPVDFKLSKGYNARVLVEVKWSKNSKLVHGYCVQLDEYAKAERTCDTIFLVIQVTAGRTAIDEILQLQAQAIQSRQRAGEIKLVDGRPKKSASHYEEAEA